MAPFDKPLLLIAVCSNNITITQSWTWVGSIHGLDWVGRKITTFYE